MTAPATTTVVPPHVAPGTKVWGWRGAQTPQKGIICPLLPSHRPTPLPRTRTTLGKAPFWFCVVWGVYYCQRHLFSMAAPANLLRRRENELDDARHTCGRFASHTLPYKSPPAVVIGPAARNFYVYYRRSLCCVHVEGCGPRDKRCKTPTYRALLLGGCSLRYAVDLPAL